MPSAYKHAMKMQGQHEQKSGSILGKDFGRPTRVSLWERGRDFWERHMHAFHGEKLLIAAGAWLIITSTSFVLAQIAYNPAFVTIAGQANPLSRVAPYLALETTINTLSKSATDRRNIAMEKLFDVHRLVIFGEQKENPVLTAINTLRSERPLWHQTLEELDGLTKKTVESNDILRRISLGTIQFNSESRTGTLSGVKILSDGPRSSTSIAAEFLRNLESGSTIQDVKSSDPVTREESSSGTLMTFTPLDISFAYVLPTPASTNNPTTQIDALRSLSLPQ